MDYSNSFNRYSICVLGPPKVCTAPLFRVGPISTLSKDQAVINSVPGDCAEVQLSFNSDSCNSDQKADTKKLTLATGTVKRQMYSVPYSHTRQKFLRHEKSKQKGYQYVPVVSMT